MSADVKAIEVNDDVYSCVEPSTGSINFQKEDSNDLSISKFCINIIQRTFEIDQSSLNPCFEPLHWDSVIEKVSESEVFEEIIEHDVFVCIPPKRRYVDLTITKVRRGELKIYESNIS